MKTLKTVPGKKPAKHDRERQVLIGLIELYLKNGKPIGSNTLKDISFGDLSSATIRNYFVNLEEQGYLSQQHTSGGRIPTAKAFRLYAKEYEFDNSLSEEHDLELKQLRKKETHELATFLEQSAEMLSNLTQSAIFLSAPRFDHDHITDLKLVGIDANRCLCVIVTNFGLLQTEVLHLDKKLSSFSLKRIESYIQWRLHHVRQKADTVAMDKPEHLSEEEELLGKQFYNEMMMRFIVRYTNFTDEDIYRTGFSKLLEYPELQDTIALTNCLALFENVHSIRLLLKECTKKDALRFWIGEDLKLFAKEPFNFSVITVPYYINKQPIGAVGLLGPLRLPYRQIFGILRNFSENISEALTRSIYKFKITFRQPESGAVENAIDDPRLLGHTRLRLIEHNR